MLQTQALDRRENPVRLYCSPSPPLPCHLQEAALLTSRSYLFFRYSQPTAEQASTDSHLEADRGTYARTMERTDQVRPPTHPDRSSLRFRVEFRNQFLSSFLPGWLACCSSSPPPFRPWSCTAERFRIGKRADSGGKMNPPFEE